ncbi:cytoskeleton protein RodZ [Vibrio methylphosphonaticus]|uniref:cytoskeleton protein RodZ n=1 Tax=Vibrio methylphosphonaticus TaxID=2946866 RepID=UPI002029CBE5|nr:cytoskeleton protein RodZ [Vibrio methylphosphonaticus]MCL9775972.1 cytoskeleton protein RodZ [Vibrio methylphosphonaticus]
MSTDSNQSTERVLEEKDVVLAGTILKQKREALGLTQKQIADRLRLRVAIIQKIESNEFDGELVATFTRGYLRSYAKAVGVEEKEVLGAIDHHGEAQHSEQEMQSFSQKTNKEKHDSRIMKLTWGIFAVIIGISSVWWLQNQQKDTLSEIADTSEPTVEVAETDSESNSAQNTTFDTLPAEATEQVKTLDVSAVLESSEAEAQPATVDNDMVAVDDSVATDSDIEESTAPQVTEKKTAENGLTNLTMSFEGDCWIQVKDANGKTVTTGIKKPGELVDVNGKAPFKIILGAPEKVSMTFASEPVDLSGYTSGKVARFTLP